MPNSLFNLCAHLAHNDGFFYSLIRDSFVFGITAAIVAAIIAPLKFLGRQKQQTGESYGQIIKDRTKKYGISVLYNGVWPLSLANFLVNGSFGIATVLSNEIICKFHINIWFIAFLIRIIMAGLCETLITLHVEAKEIGKNKIGTASSAGTIISIVFPVLIRNCIVWIAAIFTIDIMMILNTQYGITLNITDTLLLSLAIGIVFNSISIPIDVIITQNFGANDNLTFIDRIRKNITEDGFMGLFRGSIMRLIMLTIFTMLTVFVDRWLHGV